MGGRKGGTAPISCCSGTTNSGCLNLITRRKEGEHCAPVRLRPAGVGDACGADSVTGCGSGGGDARGVDL